MRSLVRKEMFARNTSRVAILTRSFHRLSGEQELLRATCRNFAEQELKPIASKLDKERLFPGDKIEKLGRLGLLSVCASPKWGGCGQNMLSLSLVVEEISKGCAGVGAIVSIHNCLYVNLIDSIGTDEQKERFLKPFTSGLLGCFALSEADAGSDVAAMTASAVEDGDVYILNGTKTWVTSGIEAKAAVVFATIDKSLKHKGITAFLVPLPSPGLTLGKPEDKMGIRASSTCNLILENVKIPKENVLGAIGGGFKIAMKQLTLARIGIASQALGIGQSALECALKYSSTRKAFGSLLNQKQLVKMRIADMACKLEAARLLVRRAALMCDEQKSPTKEASMAKLAASDAANFTAQNAVQILGGMGYVSDMPAERHYRDAKITEIYGGVTDIQKLIVADLIIKQYK